MYSAIVSFKLCKSISGIGLTMFVRPSSLRRWPISLLFASQTPITIHILKAYDERYSKIIREHKYKEIDIDKDTDKLPLSAFFYFFSIFPSGSKILSLQKLPPFLLQYSSPPQTKNFPLSSFVFLPGPNIFLL